MKSLASALVLVALTAAAARATTMQIGPGDTALLFGGSDAEGGIGDWYVSNGTIEAIIDDVGPAPDLVGVVPPGTEPPVQSEIAFTGGTLIDLGRVGTDDDQLSQMFTVGGLSTANFLVYDNVSAPDAFTIRATGKVLFPPVSVEPSPCLDVVTDYALDPGGAPFLTITSTATNNCGVSIPAFGGLLDVFIWTIRGIVPFSGGNPRGFNHPVLNLGNPAGSVEAPMYMSAPGIVRPADGSWIGDEHGMRRGVLRPRRRVDPSRSRPGVAGERLFGVRARSSRRSATSRSMVRGGRHPDLRAAPLRRGPERRPLGLERYPRRARDARALLDRHDLRRRRHGGLAVRPSDDDPRDPHRPLPDRRRRVQGERRLRRERAVRRPGPDAGARGEPRDVAGADGRERRVQRRRPPAG
jgi:hypothetical protein